MCAESIEFYDGEEHEKESADMLLENVTVAYMEWIRASIPLVSMLVAQAREALSCTVLMVVVGADLDWNSNRAHLYVHQ